jgi:transposase-like protein
MRKKYSKQEKAKIVLELLREEKTINQIAAEYGVHPTQLAQWKKTALEGLPDLFENKGREIQKVVKEHQQEVEQLYKKIGDLTIQVDWLKKKSDEIVLKRRKKGSD